MVVFKCEQERYGRKPDYCLTVTMVVFKYGNIEIFGNFLQRLTVTMVVFK